MTPEIDHSGMGSAYRQVPAPDDRQPRAWLGAVLLALAGVSGIVVGWVARGAS